MILLFINKGLRDICLMSNLNQKSKSNLFKVPCSECGSHTRCVSSGLVGHCITLCKFDTLTVEVRHPLKRVLVIWF